MYRVEDPVFAMDESFFLDAGSRLDDVDGRSLTLRNQKPNKCKFHFSQTTRS